MAGSYSLQPPGSFKFKNPTDWPKWKKRFEQYRSASGLSEETEERQVNTLLYCLGENAEDVLKSTSISDADAKKYDKVMEKFDGLCSVRKNVIFERACFNRRTQRPNETADQYITELHRLAETCEYGALKDEMIRDRLVVGITDQYLSEKLQMESKLTLEQAKDRIRQSEAVREQQKVLSSSDGKPQQHTTQVIEPVYRGQRPVGQRKKVKGFQQTMSGKRTSMTAHNNQPTSSHRKCRRCGKETHPRQQCPAIMAQCHRCNRKGHYSSQCLSKTLQELSLYDTEQDEQSADEISMEATFLDNVTSSDQESKLLIEIRMGSQPVSFKVDTGAEVTAVSEITWFRLHLPDPLKETKLVLSGPDHKPLEVLGMFTSEISYKQ